MAECLEVGDECLEMAEVDEMNSSPDDQTSLEELSCMMKSEERERFVIQTKADPTLKVCRNNRKEVITGLRTYFFSLPLMKPREMSRLL